MSPRDQYGTTFRPSSRPKTRSDLKRSAKDSSGTSIKSGGGPWMGTLYTSVRVRLASMVGS